jgi:hypothetical protein
MSAQHDRLEIYIRIYKLHVQSFNKIAEVKDTRRYEICLRCIWQQDN